MLDADVEGIPLHVLGAAPVSCLQDLDDVVHADISLQVVLAKDLQTVVGKDVERGLWVKSIGMSRRDSSSFLVNSAVCQSLEDVQK